MAEYKWFSIVKIQLVGIQSDENGLLSGNHKVFNYYPHYNATGSYDSIGNKNGKGGTFISN